jgi:hypothetical protein
MRYTVMEYFRTHKFNLNMYQYFARTINWKDLWSEVYI